MLYQITDGTVSVGGNVILSHIDFEIKEKEKIAVVGRNGAGKSTLLKLIAGELQLDRDDKRIGAGISTSRKITIGMLKQNFDANNHLTVGEILQQSCPETDRYSEQRYQYELEYRRIFTGFGFEKEAEQRKFSSFSGGEQTKIELIRLLILKPDILLLDEPTNHLDIQTVEWLEQYLQEYDKAVVFVSHDRFFLDRVVNVVYEISGGKMTKYAGNYTQYRAQKQKNLALWKKEYKKQQEELERLNELIEKFKHKPKKAAFARSRKTLVDRMQMIPKPEEDEVHIFTGAIEPKMPGNKLVLEAEHLKIGYDKMLLELSLRVRRGQKIGIIGENGVGKSTFLKTIAGITAPLDGKYRMGGQIMFGYFDQHTADIQSDKTVLEHFHSLFPGMTEKEIRKILGYYLFRGSKVAEKVGELSGGEKSRLILCELLNSRPNLMLLDEPTNHMDIQAKETLESAFASYTGTILFISHDRYFIQQIADSILVFEGDSVMYYPFGYEHYIKKTRGQGKNITAIIQAEEQALIADLQAVPKSERHEFPQMSTEEAFLDWKLRLAKEPMEEAKARVERLWEQAVQMQTEIQEWELQNWLEQRDTDLELEEKNKEMDILQQELDAAWDRWTDCCMDWYEILL